jgi:epoxyqueuosine reductase
MSSTSHSNSPTSQADRIAVPLAEHMRVLDRVMASVMKPAVLRRLWVIPPLVPFRRRRVWPRIGPWPSVQWVTPEALLSYAGVQKDLEAEERYGRELPYLDWATAHPETRDAFLAHGWRYYLPTAPFFQRAKRFAARRALTPPATRKAPLDPVALTEAVRARAAELGISACGIAPYSETYTFVQSRGLEVGDRVVIGVLEANWASAQEMPTARGEKSLKFCDGALTRRMAMLGEFIAGLGYRVRFNPASSGDSIVIPYAVEAGLGQLGLNGQLLTPRAGSRCRLWTLNTDAPLVFDAPVDFGIPKICDACQVCVRRCPSGAITNRRRLYRGIEKARINPERCIPVIGQQNHCAVCIKVCPVQRYGLTAVVDEFTATGRILGKGTDELEAYEFDGERYGTGTRPKLPPEFFTRIPYDDTTGTVRVSETTQ